MKLTEGIEMSEMIESVSNWFLNLSGNYGVDPIIFGSIYVGAIPFFTLCLAWLCRNYRLQKSTILPALLTIFFFISTYLYLIIVGQNVPWWVYGMIVPAIAYGSWFALRKIRTKVSEMDPKIIIDE